MTLPDGGDTQGPHYGLADLKGILPAVLAGGGVGGLVSGYLASQSRPRLGEDEDERRKRIINSALLGAIMSGGGTGLGAYAWKNISKAAPPMGEVAAYMNNPEKKPSLVGPENLIGAAALGGGGLLAPIKDRATGAHKWSLGRNGNWGTRAWRGGVGSLIGAAMAPLAYKGYYHMLTPTMQN